MSNFWEDFGNKKPSSGSKIVNKKLDEGTHQVRLVAEPIEFRKLFVNGKSATISENSQLLITKGLDKPSARYAALVIDRADGALKVIECPASPFKPLVSWRKLKKRDPAGPNGCDLGIDVTGSGKDKRYVGIALDDSPLTAEEQAMVDAAKIDLSKLYRALSDEEAEARLYGTGPGVGKTPAKAPAARPNPTTAPAATTASKAPAAVDGEEADIPF